MKNNNQSTVLDTDPSNLRSALEQIRKETINESLPEKSDLGGIRATLSNLIILIPEDCPDEDKKVNELIDELAKTHPSRFFILHLISDLKEPIFTRVASRNVVNASDINIQTEEIYIDVREDSIHLIKNLILSNLIPDIDTIALEIYPFKTKNYSTTLLKDLFDLIDIYISPDPLYLVSNDLLNKDSTKPRILDIAWPSTSIWRELIIEQFDSELACSNLNNTSVVDIHYESNTDNNDSSLDIPREAFLVATWILKSLKIKPEANAKTQDKDKHVIKCSGSEMFINKPELRFIKEDKSGLSKICKIKILMQNNASDTYLVNISFLPELNLIEVESGGSNDNSTGDVSTGEKCEFYVRRTPVKETSYTKSALSLIRGSSSPLIQEEYQKLYSLIAKN